MLESASGSRPSYPGYPPAAYGGLVSLVPDLNSWPSEGARLRRAAAAWSKRYDPLLRHEVEGADGLGSLGYQVWAPGPQIDERRTRNMTRVAKGQSAPWRADDVLGYSTGYSTGHSGVVVPTRQPQQHRHLPCRRPLRGAAERRRRHDVSATGRFFFGNSSLIIIE